MLNVEIVLEESFNDETNEFIVNSFNLQLEHSLVSLSKWESKFEKPFLTQEGKTPEEILGYIEAMIITPEYPENLLSHLSQENAEQIKDYIESKQSATWFNDKRQPSRSTETLTSELIYYWLTVYHIPFEPAETWHLSRLFNLIKIASLKNQKPEKMSRSEQLAQQREIVARRRAELGTNG